MIEGTLLQNQRYTALVESLITDDEQLLPMLSMVFNEYDELVRQIMFSAQFGNAEYRMSA